MSTSTLTVAEVVALNGIVLTPQQIASAEAYIIEQSLEITLVTILEVVLTLWATR